MINLHRAQVLNGVPEILKKQPWVEAISFATACALERVFALADKTFTYANVMQLDHDVLDTLAIDLHVLHYDQSFDLDTKRRLILFALQYWATAGSVAATEQVARIIFGEADISEWFEYGGTPGCFKIAIRDNLLTDADVLRFKDAAEQNKRLSAWLDRVVLDMPPRESVQYVGFFVAEDSDDLHRMKRDPSYYVGCFLLDRVCETHTMEV